MGRDHLLHSSRFHRLSIFALMLALAGGAGLCLVAVASGGAPDIDADGRHTEAKPARAGNLEQANNTSVQAPTSSRAGAWAASPSQQAIGLGVDLTATFDAEPDDLYVVKDNGILFLDLPSDFALHDRAGGGHASYGSYAVTPVPEPKTALLLAIAGLAFFGPTWRWVG